MTDEIPASACSKCRDDSIFDERFDEEMTTTFGGMTALHRALCIGHANCAKAYLTGNKNMEIEQLNHALLIAAKSGIRRITAIIPDLLEAGANPQAEDDDRISSIMHALRRRDAHCLETLLHFGTYTSSSYTRPPNLSKIAQSLRKRYAPMMSAITKGSLKCLNLLIEYNDKFKWTFPSSTWIRKRSSYFSSDSWERILMMILKTKGHLDAVLLDSVIQRGDSDLLRRLLERRIPLVTPQGKPDADYSWLPNAVVCQASSDMLSVVLEYRDVYGIDINACTRAGPSLLQVACGRCSNPDVINMLLCHGADPDIIGTRGWSTNLGTPLFRTVQAMAFKADAMQVLITLLAYNCKLSTKCKLNRSGSAYGTPLDFALLSNNLYAAFALVLAGAKRFNLSRTDNLPVDLVPFVVRCTDKEKATFIKTHIQSPGSLQILCRQTVNKKLGKGTPHRMEELPLPKSMISFLKYSELEATSEKFKYLMDNRVW